MYLNCGTLNVPDDDGDDYERVVCQWTTCHNEGDCDGLARKEWHCDDDDSEWEMNKSSIREITMAFQLVFSTSSTNHYTISRSGRIVCHCNNVAERTGWWTFADKDGSVVTITRKAILHVQVQWGQKIAIIGICVFRIKLWNWHTYLRYTPNNRLHSLPFATLYRLLGSFHCTIFYIVLHTF